MENGLEGLGGNTLAEYGTKKSGFAGGGPFSCSHCIHMTHVDDQMVCTHPKVNSDPELEDRDRAGSYVSVDGDDCCRYVRPPKK